MLVIDSGDTHKLKRSTALRQARLRQAQPPGSRSRRSPPAYRPQQDLRFTAILG
ncbi:MAG: hypothetical protein KME46_26430 [Brasilonema angustatum HA4187-MV1]|nr:hypothetical protein [Brasilonema angustatum HA4187-MV1]